MRDGLAEHFATIVPAELVWVCRLVTRARKVSDAASDYTHPMFMCIRVAHGSASMGKGKERGEDQSTFHATGSALW